MFIESLKVSYPSEGWSLEETKFDRFNLLVGASGVGKTRILEAIEFLSKLASHGGFGKDYPSDVVEWAISLRTDDGSEFLWKGKIEMEESEERGSRQTTFVPRFDQESISVSGKQIASRVKEVIELDQFNLPKMSENLSLIQLFERDEMFRKLSASLKNTFSFSELELENAFLNSIRDLDLGRSLTVQQIRDSDANLGLRLYWLKEHSEGHFVFERIKDRFIEIFPFVEDLLAGIHSNESIAVDPRLVWGIFEPELNSSTGVELSRASSGMKKVLALLAQIELCPDRSLILIDEFENSLGTNCIDLVADAILNANRNVQFIITSHHPYIINKIGFQHWKIVTREGGVVSTHPASEFGLGRSRHENFSQLVQLEAFQTGMMPK